MAHGVSHGEKLGNHNTAPAGETEPSLAILLLLSPASGAHEVEIAGHPTAYAMGHILSGLGPLAYVMGYDLSPALSVLCARKKG